MTYAEMCARYWKTFNTACATIWGLEEGKITRSEYQELHKRHRATKLALEIAERKLKAASN